MFFGLSVLFFLLPSLSTHSLLSIYYSLSSEHNQIISSNFLSFFFNKVLPLFLSIFPHLESYFFCVSLLFHLNILISTTLILWICYFLTAQHLAPSSIANGIAVL